MLRVVVVVCHTFTANSAFYFRLHLFQFVDFRRTCPIWDNSGEPGELSRLKVIVLVVVLLCIFLSLRRR